MSAIQLGRPDGGFLRRESPNSSLPARDAAMAESARQQAARDLAFAADLLASRAYRAEKAADADLAAARAASKTPPVAAQLAAHAARVRAYRAAPLDAQIKAALQRNRQHMSAIADLSPQARAFALGSPASLPGILAAHHVTRHLTGAI